LCKLVLASSLSSVDKCPSSSDGLFIGCKLVLLERLMWNQIWQHFLFRGTFSFRFSVCLSFLPPLTSILQMYLCIFNPPCWPPIMAHLHIYCTFMVRYSKLKRCFSGVLRRMLGYLLSTCLCESLALVYSLAMQRNETNNSVYLAYVWFWCVFHDTQSLFLYHICTFSLLVPLRLCDSCCYKVVVHIITL
jgi:hypothetical protein